MMKRWLLGFGAAALAFGLSGVEAKQICVEELSGTCLKYKTVPDGPPPAALAERRLSLSAADRRVVQRGLAAAGHYSGAIDGAFGPQSRRAIRAWQRANGARATGYLTESAVASLKRSATAARPAPSTLTPAPSDGSNAQRYLALCGDFRNRSTYSVAYSGVSLEDARRRAKARFSYCEYDAWAQNGHCVAIARTATWWSQRTGASRREAIATSVNACSSRSNRTCAVNSKEVWCTKR